MTVESNPNDFVAAISLVDQPPAHEPPGSNGVVSAEDPGRLAAHIPAGWNTPGGVHGGMLAATALNAARTYLDRPDLALRTGHVLFLEPPDNELEFEVDVIRQGRRAAHARVIGRSRSSGRPATSATVMFTLPTTSCEWLDAVLPESPDPLSLTPDRERVWPEQVKRDPTPLLDHMDLRSVPGLVPWETGWEPDMPARYQRWIRYVDTPWLGEPGHDGPGFDPLALVPMADLPTSAIWVRMPIERLPVYCLSLDMWISFFEPPTDDWVLTDIRARWLGDGHAHMETDLWSDGRLVAMSTQTMLRLV